MLPGGDQVQERLALHRHDVRGIETVIIWHDHGDHSRLMGVYQAIHGVTRALRRKPACLPRIVGFCPRPSAIR